MVELDVKATHLRIRGKALKMETMMQMVVIMPVTITARCSIARYCTMWTILYTSQLKVLLVLFTASAIILGLDGSTWFALPWIKMARPSQAKRNRIYLSKSKPVRRENLVIQLDRPESISGACPDQLVCSEPPKWLLTSTASLIS
jgi:hypothetical protein